MKSAGSPEVFNASIASESRLCCKSNHSLEYMVILSGILVKDGCCWRKRLISALSPSKDTCPFLSMMRLAEPGVTK